MCSDKAGGALEGVEGEHVSGQEPEGGRAAAAADGWMEQQGRSAEN